MPTPIWICGGECGLTGNNGGNVVASMPPHVGVNVVNSFTNVVAPGGRSGRALRFTGSQGVAAVSFESAVASPATLVFRFFLYFATLPTADATIVDVATITGGPRVKFESSDGSIRAGGTAGDAGSGKVVTTGVWYRVDCKIVSGATCTVDVQVDGVALAQHSVASAATSVLSFALGTAGSGGEWYLDDIMVSGTSGDYPIGEGRVVGLFPNGDGSHTYNSSGDFNKGGTANTALATPSSSETTTWVNLKNPLADSIDTANFLTAVANATDGTEFLQWTLDDMPSDANGATINGLSVIAAHHAGGTATSLQSLSLNDGGSLVTIESAIDWSETTLRQGSKIRNTNAAGGSWTKQLLDALLIRWWSTDNNPDAMIDGVCLEVDYVPVAHRRIIVPLAAVRQSFRW